MLIFFYHILNRLMILYFRPYILYTLQCTYSTEKTRSHAFHVIQICMHISSKLNEYYLVFEGILLSIYCSFK